MKGREDTEENAPKGRVTEEDNSDSDFSERRKVRRRGVGRRVAENTVFEVFRIFESKCF